MLQLGHSGGLGGCLHTRTCLHLGVHLGLISVSISVCARATPPDCASVGNVGHTHNTDTQPGLDQTDLKLQRRRNQLGTSRFPAFPSRCSVLAHQIDYKPSRFRAVSSWLSAPARQFDYKPSRCVRFLIDFHGLTHMSSLYIYIYIWVHAYPGLVTQHMEDSISVTPHKLETNTLRPDNKKPRNQYFRS